MNQLAVPFHVVPVMAMTTTGGVLLVFCVWLRLLLRLPFCELTLAFFTLVEGLDVGQEAPGYGLDLILERDLSRMFLSYRIIL